MTGCGGWGKFGCEQVTSPRVPFLLWCREGALAGLPASSCTSWNDVCFSDAGYTLKSSILHVYTECGAPCSLDVLPVGWGSWPSHSVEQRRPTGGYQIPLNKLGDLKY